MELLRDAEGGNLQPRYQALDRVEFDLHDAPLPLPDVVRSGLANLARRAEKRGGTFSLDSQVTSGTTLRWRVPLGPDVAPTLGT